MTKNPARKDIKRPLINSSLVSSAHHQGITYLQMLRERRVLVALISSAIAMILMFFFDSILSDHLLDIGVSDSDIGYFFGLICFFYVISAPAVLWLCKKMKRRYVT